MNKNEALDLALEVLEYIDLCDNDRDFLHPHECFQLDKAITAIKQARSAPAQKPAFYGFMDKENCCVHICYTPWAPRMTDGKLPTAFYTTAAQQQWVWLSKEDEQEIKDNCTTVACVLKAVKAKLKEKNNG